jgi:ankyrin repeat protein
MALSSLMQALYEGKTDEARAIADARSDLDVFEAGAIGSVDRLRALLDEDPSLVNAWSEDGFTALHFAAFFGHPSAARLLTERGAELEARSTNREFAFDATPLHSAAAAGQLRVCDVLLDAGSDVNAVQHGGYTALLDAAANGNGELVDLLLERGADPSARLDDGRTAADLATAAGDPKVAARFG